MGTSNLEGYDTNPVVATKNSLSRRRWPWVLASLAAIIFIILLIETIRLPRKPSTNKKQVIGAACSATSPGSLSQQAVVLFDGTKQIQLAKIVAKIQKIPNYQQEPNCLYPIVRYYINMSDAKNARLYLDKLTKVYNPKQKFSAYSPYNVPDITTLQDQIKFLEKIQPQSFNNGQEPLSL